MKSKNKRAITYDSSDQQGFQESQIRVIETSSKPLPTPIPILQPLRVSDLKQTISKKFTYSCFSIYTNILLFPYPSFLDFGLEDTIVKMEKNKNKDKDKQKEKEKQQSEVVESVKDVGEFLKSGNYRLVYNRYDSRVDYKIDMTNFYKSFEYYLDSPTKDNFKEFSGKDTPNTEDIEFSSNFQSGNLHFVFSNDNTFYLLLQNDVNTHGYNQWFYFRIRNKRKCKVKIMILNMTKSIELMKNAMGISVFSIQQKSFCRKYWTEGGNNVKFYKNGLKRKTKSKVNNQYYTLEFDYEFKFESDSVYFAMNIPYTYTKLMNSIDGITSVKREHIAVNVKVLGGTVANNKIYTIQYAKRHKTLHIEALKGSSSTMDELEVPSAKQTLINSSRSILNKRKKKSIIFLGRQHPCETNSSYVLEGIINFLSEESEVSLFLLETYDIYVIPMVNPDGVIHGNSRTNLCGYDVNREWSNKNRERSNEVHAISSYIEYLNETTDVKYIFDLHSTSKKLGTYGHFSEDTLQLRSFAWFLQQTNPNFVYSSCIFDKSKSKQPNFRNYAYNLGIKNSITIEISYFGKLEHGLFRRYNTKQLSDIGVAIIKTLSEFSELDVSKVIINNFVKSNVKEGVGDGVVSESQPEEDYLEERERVKIILSGRREKESSQPKGFTRNISPTKPKLLKKISSTFTKTMVNIREEDQSKTVESPKHPHLSTHTSSLYVFAEKPFKPYSKQQILRDDSLASEFPSPKRRHTQHDKPTKSPSRLYFWDESKYNVSKPISYPTSLFPYLQRLPSADLKIFDTSPVRRRVSTTATHKHSITTQIQLQKVIMQSSGGIQQKQYSTIFQKRKKSRAYRNIGKKLFPTTMKGNLSSNFHY